MAERETEASGIVGGIVDAVFLPFEMIGKAVGNVVQAIFADGTLEAAGRQGLDELGAALKAFPDSIQVQESGTIWNPTQGEIAASRNLGGEIGERPSWSSLAAPRSAEAADHNRHQPELDQGHDHDAGHSM